MMRELNYQPRICTDQHGCFGVPMKLPRSLPQSVSVRDNPWRNFPLTTSVPGSNDDATN